MSQAQFAIRTAHIRPVAEAEEVPGAGPEEARAAGPEEAQES